MAMFNGTLDVDLHDLSDFKNALFEAKGSVSKRKIIVKNIYSIHYLISV